MWGSRRVCKHTASQSADLGGGVPEAVLSTHSGAHTRHAHVHVTQSVYEYTSDLCGWGLTVPWQQSLWIAGIPMQLPALWTPLVSASTRHPRGHPSRGRGGERQRKIDRHTHARSLSQAVCIEVYSTKAPNATIWACTVCIYVPYCMH